MTDNAAALLLHSREKTRHIDKSKQRNVEGIAEPDKSSRLIGGIDVKRAGQNAWLVGHNPDWPALQAPKADDNVGSESGLDLEEIPIVHNASDDAPDVISNLGVDRNNLVHFRIGFHPRIESHTGRILKVVGRHETEQPPAKQKRFVVIPGDEVNHSRAVHLRLRATKLLRGDNFAGDLFDHLRPGNEDLSLLGLDHEVGERRAVGGAPRTRSTNQRNLRHRS